MAKNRNLLHFGADLSAGSALAIAGAIDATSGDEVRVALLQHAADGGSLEALRELGKEWRFTHFKKAVRALEVAHNAGDRQSTLLLGEIYYDNAYGKHEGDRLDLAEDLLRKVVDLSSAPRLLAYTYWQMGDADRACSLLLEYMHDDWDAAIAAVHSKNVVGDEAILVLERHLERGRFEVLGELGRLYKKVGRIEDARIAWENALVFGNQDFIVVLGKLLWASEVSADRMRARKLWRRAAKWGDYEAKKLLKRTRPKKHDKSAGKRPKQRTKGEK